MAQREIYEVSAKIVDANGTYNTLSGYPITFDSKNYQNDLDKTFKRAEGAWHECCGAMAKLDNRQLQIAFCIRVSDGMMLMSKRFGQISEVL